MLRYRVYAAAAITIRRGDTLRARAARRQESLPPFIRFYCRRSRRHRPFASHDHAAATSAILNRSDGRHGLPFAAAPETSHSPGSRCSSPATPRVKVRLDASVNSRRTPIAAATRAAKGASISPPRATGARDASAAPSERSPPACGFCHLLDDAGARLSGLALSTIREYR